MKVESSSMPRSLSLRLLVVVLAGSLFVVTSSEFQVSAMLTTMSADLNTSVADLGLLVTFYSLGMGLGGPAIAVALRRIRPRRALVSVMLCYAVVEGLGGAATGVETLLVLRLLAGALSGAMFGMALSAGMRAVDESHRSRVSAGVLAGLMAGTLLGLPLSHLLATTAGWRASFWMLAAAAVAMSTAVHLVLPHELAGANSEGENLRALRSRRLWVRYLTSFLVIGGAFAAFAFIDPLLERAGLTPLQTTLTMLGFGAAAFLLNHLTGRVHAGAVRGWLLTGVTVQLVALVIALMAPDISLLMVLAAVLLGGTGIALNPLLVQRVVSVGGSGVLVSTVHTSAITIGIAAATTLGSLAITETGDLDGTLIVGIALTVAAGAVAVLSRTTARTDHSRRR
jgi:DHA1 family inner membrane transport protein